MKWLAGVLALSLLMIEARAVLSGRSELLRAERASSASERVMHLRRAARWRAPFSPYPETALRRLRALALTTSDPALALIAWESIRGALLGSRVFGVPGPERLREANDRIAALRAGASSGDDHRRLLATLERVRGPDRWWSAAALVGLCAWIAGGVGLGKRTGLRIGLVVGGFALFLAGLALA